MKKNLSLFILFIFILLVFPLSNAFAYEKISCGNITGIPIKIPEISSMIFTVIQIAVPVALVLIGSIDFFKGMISQKEDQMKKSQNVFIKRLIMAALIFFVIVIVKLIISIVADKTDSKNISSCIDCFISGNCKADNS